MKRFASPATELIIVEVNYIFTSNSYHHEMLSRGLLIDENGNDSTLEFAPIKIIHNSYPIRHQLDKTWDNDLDRQFNNEDVTEDVTSPQGIFVVPKKAEVLRRAPTPEELIYFQKYGSPIVKEHIKAVEGKPFEGEKYWQPSFGDRWEANDLDQ